MSTLAQVDLGESFTIQPGGRPVREFFSTPADLINVLLPNIFLFAGILLFIFTIGAGFQMVMNPNDKKSQEEGKKKLGYAVGGFVLLFASYWIMQIIGAVLGIQLLGEGNL